MKKYLMYLGVLGLLAIPAQGAFAWDMSYLNPLPYVGIGENKTNFSLNPFTGFKNCNKCKVKKVKCNECTKPKIMPCPTCKKAFADCGCNKMERVYVVPIQPKCSSCEK